MGATQQHGNQKAWKSATITVLDAAKDRVEQVRKAVEGLELREKDKLAAMLAERRRQELREAAAEERRQKEARRRAEEELKRMQAAELKARKEEAEQAKKDASSALKAATANFHKATQQEADNKEKAEAHKQMNDASQAVGNAVSKCQLECRMKFSVMMVCEKRLKMRENRPQQEFFVDEVHEALEKEWTVVNAAREELQGWVKQGEAVRVQIEHVSMMLTTGNSRDNVARRLRHSTSLPSLAQRASESPSTQDLLDKSRELVERAKLISHASKEAIERTSEECDASTAAVTACFGRRKAETDFLRKSLDQQRKSAKATLLDAERRISLLKMRMRKISESPRSREQTQEQLTAAEALLAELKGQKQVLEADYRLKTSSFNIDKSCTTLTKVRAGTHASKLEPVTLTASQSSPALAKTA